MPSNSAFHFFLCLSLLVFSSSLRLSLLLSLCLLFISDLSLFPRISLYFSLPRLSLSLPFSALCLSFFVSLCLFLSLLSVSLSSYLSVSSYFISYFLRRLSFLRVYFLENSRRLHSTIPRCQYRADSTGCYLNCCRVYSTE